MSAQLKAGVAGLGILGSQHAQFLDNHPHSFFLDRIRAAAYRP